MKLFGSLALAFILTVGVAARAGADPGVTLGAIVFGGYTRSLLTSATPGVAEAAAARYNASGFDTTSTTIDRRSTQTGTAGGTFMVKFGQSPVGADVSYRFQKTPGPRLVSVADRTSVPTAHDETRSTLDIQLSALSVGARVDLGRAFFIEPVVDLNFWRATTTTAEGQNVAAIPGVPIDRTGRSAGFGIRAFGTVAGPLAVGAEYHRVYFDGPTPDNPIAPWPSKFHADQIVGVVAIRVGP